MAIRFQCGSCSQPIEIDDQWASKSVACPYCRNTVTAPSESTLGDLAEVPMASALADQWPPPANPSDAVATSAARSVHPNQIAIVAFSLACTMIVLITAAAFVAAPHRLEMESLLDRVAALQEEGAEPWSARMQASTEFGESYGGGPPGWMIAFVLFYVAAGLAWMATIVCGLIGIRRVLRRRMAITALVMAGAIPILLCFGVLFPAGGS